MSWCRRESRPGIILAFSVYMYGTIKHSEKRDIERLVFPLSVYYDRVGTRLGSFAMVFQWGSAMMSAFHWHRVTVRTLQIYFPYFYVRYHSILFIWNCFISWILLTFLSRLKHGRLVEMIWYINWDTGYNTVVSYDRNALVCSSHEIWLRHLLSEHLIHSILLDYNYALQTEALAGVNYQHFVISALLTTIFKHPADVQIRCIRRTVFRLNSTRLCPASLPCNGKKWT